MTELAVCGEEAQIAFGKRLAPCLLEGLSASRNGPLVVFLNGDLGTGKTTLVRGVLRGLGHPGTVRSPTYTLIEPYELADVRLYHLDLYRLGDPDELEYLGLRDLDREDALLLVEWPDRGSGALPPPDLRIDLGYQPDGRRLTLTAGRPGGRVVLACLGRSG